nr:hypothetical protein [Tanacetum cinerariifolium]
MSKHNAIYVIPSYIKKVFSNMRRARKDFSGRDTPLFLTMLVQPQADMGEGSTVPSALQHTPIIQLTTSKPQKKQKPKKPRRYDTQETQPIDPITNVEDEALNEENVSTQSNDPPLSRVNTLGNGEGILKLKELIEICTKLQQRVIDLENTKTVQAKKISCLKRRVKKLEKKKRSGTHGLKRLYKVGLSARMESSAKEQSLGKEEASKQERNIDDIDVDAKTTLVNETIEDQGRYNDEEMFDTDVLNDEEVVVEDDNAAITAVSIYDITLAQALVEIKTSKPKERGIIMQKPIESPITTIQISSKVQDKRKGIMVEEPLKMKNKDQIGFVEQEDRRLQAEIDKQDRLAKEKGQLIKDENLAWDNV